MNNMELLKIELVRNGFYLVSKENNKEIWVNSGSDLIRVKIDMNENIVTFYYPLINTWIPVMEDKPNVMDMIHKLERFIEISNVNVDYTFDDVTVRLRIIGKETINGKYIVPSITFTTSLTNRNIYKLFNIEFINYVISELNSKLEIYKVIEYTRKIIDLVNSLKT